MSFKWCDGVNVNLATIPGGKISATLSATDDPSINKTISFSIDIDRNTRDKLIHREAFPIYRDWWFRTYGGPA